MPQPEDDDDRDDDDDDDDDSMIITITYQLRPLVELQLATGIATPSQSGTMRLSLQLLPRSTSAVVKDQNLGRDLGRTDRSQLYQCVCSRLPPALFLLGCGHGEQSVVTLY